MGRRDPALGNPEGWGDQGQRDGGQVREQDDLMQGREFWGEPKGDSLCKPNQTFISREID